MKKPKKQVVNFLIAFVWFVNGVFCKILILVPRHQQIVAEILNEEYAREITLTIGVLEVFMVLWILSHYKSKLNAIVQIAIIMTMNIIEFFLTKNILLFGSLNLLFAFLFVVIIYYQEFILKEKRNV